MPAIILSCLPVFCSAECAEETGLLVLEDLTRRPGKVISSLERESLMDFHHVKTCLSSLAHFHGGCWRWLMRNRQNSGQISHLHSLHADSWFIEFCFKTIFRMMRKMLRTFLENRKENSHFISRFDNFMKNEIFNVMKVMWSNKSPSKFDTIIHGSFWSSNILFQYPDQGRGQLPQKALFVDFQQIGLGNPCRDILSLLYTNTSASFRNKYMDILVQNYFATFQEYFQGFFPVSQSNYQEFEKNIEESRTFGLAWGLYMICVGKISFG